MREHCFGVSLYVINDFLSRGRIIIADRLPSMDVVAKELSNDEKKSRPKKGFLDRSAKFSVLHRIGVAN